MKFSSTPKIKRFIAKWGPLFFLIAFLRLVLFVILDWKSKIHLSAITLIVLMLWSILVEPRTIVTQKRYFDLPCKAKIALISDLHLGPYKKQGFLTRIIKKINRLRVDYIFIAGDLTNYPKIKDLDALFAPLKDTHVPVYLVLGNHDVEKPGHPIRPQLEAAIQKTGARLLNNSIVHLAGFTLVGLGEYRTHEDDVSILETVQARLPVIVLTHNPLTIRKYTERHHVDLTLCGHTHGWQIRFPFIEKGVGIFSSKLKHSSRGYLTYKHHNYFITSGIGEVGLPIRFFSPPTIDVLYLGKKRRSLSKHIKDQIKEYKDTLNDILLRKKA